MIQNINLYFLFFTQYDQRFWQFDYLLNFVFVVLEYRNWLKNLWRLANKVKMGFGTKHKYITWEFIMAKNVDISKFFEHFFISLPESIVNMRRSHCVSVAKG